MKGMRIILTDWQYEMLKPFFDETREAFSAGEPVAVFAQIRETVEGDEVKSGFLDVRIIDGKTCEAVQAAVGVDPGKMPEKDEAVVVLHPSG